MDGFKRYLGGKIVRVWNELCCRREGEEEGVVMDDFCFMELRGDLKDGRLCV